jgi:hypothetical protein
MKTPYNNKYLYNGKDQQTRQNYKIYHFNTPLERHSIPLQQQQQQQQHAKRFVPHSLSKSTFLVGVADRWQRYNADIIDLRVFYCYVFLVFNFDPISSDEPDGRLMICFVHACQHMNSTADTHCK